MSDHDDPEAGDAPLFDAMDGEELTEPLDPADPRFTGFARPPAGPRTREFVESRGPGRSQMDVRVRIIRMAIPTIAIAGLVAVAAVFFSALTTGDSGVVVGDADDVAAAVGERPLRVCRGDGPPCAWITDVDGALLALNTSGPIHAEYGRQGVGWCPSSGYFGANSTESRYDQAGRIVAGPAQRGIDRFGLRTDDAGRLVVEFSHRSAGPPAGDGDLTPRDGPACDEIPFDRDPDLPPLDLP